MAVVALAPVHDRHDFDCGIPALNQWLRRIASQHQKSGTSKSFVLVDDAHPEKIIGFFSLAVRGLIASTELPTQISRQGKKYGVRLLFEAMERAFIAAQQVGGFALFVDAKEGAAEFYQHFGFVPLPATPNILMLPIASMPWSVAPGAA